MQLILQIINAVTEIIHRKDTTSDLSLWCPCEGLASWFSSWEPSETAQTPQWPGIQNLLQTNHRQVHMPQPIKEKYTVLNSCLNQSQTSTHTHMPQPLRLFKAFQGLVNFYIKFQDFPYFSKIHMNPVFMSKVKCHLKLIVFKKQHNKCS